MQLEEKEKQRKKEKQPRKTKLIFVTENTKLFWCAMKLIVKNT